MTLQRGKMFRNLGATSGFSSFEQPANNEMWNNKKTGKC